MEEPDWALHLGTGPMPNSFPRVWPGLLGSPSPTSGPQPLTLVYVNQPVDSFSVGREEDRNLCPLALLRGHSHLSEGDLTSLNRGERREEDRGEGEWKGREE